MKAVLLGLGYWGKTVLPIIKSLESSLGFTLEYVCDHQEENLKKCKNDYPSVRVYFDFDELISSEKVDLVFITTGIETHYSLAKRSLESGCHTFVEKPFVPDLKQACELNDLATSRSLILMVGYRLLYASSIQWIKKNIFAKTVPDGTVFEASWKNWGIHQLGGVHWDLACHYIAVLNYLTESTPEVISVNPLYINSVANNVENISLILKYPSNIISKIDVSWNNPFKVKRLVIKTPNKLIDVDHESDYPLTIYEAKTTLVQRRGRKKYDVSFNFQTKYDRKTLNEMKTIEGQFTDFIQSARTGSPVLASADIGISVIKTLCQIDALLKP